MLPAEGAAEPGHPAQLLRKKGPHRTYPAQLTENVTIA